MYIKLLMATEQEENRRTKEAILGNNNYDHPSPKISYLLVSTHFQVMYDIYKTSSDKNLTCIDHGGFFFTPIPAYCELVIYTSKTMMFT